MKEQRHDSHLFLKNSGAVREVLIKGTTICSLFYVLQCPPWTSPIVLLNLQYTIAFYSVALDAMKQ